MANRLAQSKSLYLRKHGENPIDWWPWCDEALEKAKGEDKPIFLSIGYSSCHWCTVMEGEAFSDRAIAQYMNENFVPIKVDREERPEIDSIYMQALQMMTGQGGWPLNIFLSPDDLVPFVGGTYFPVQPRYGQPGFIEVLRRVRNFYNTEKTRLQNLKQEIRNALVESTLLPASQLSEGLLQQGLTTNTGIISRNDFGGPRFPMIPYADTALHETRFDLESRYDSLQACTQRGTDLVSGGIYDHVAGGFHRYTVDPTWTVPHFEKMLYDNGQIVEYLANLWSKAVTEPAFKRSISGTVNWLKREMTASKGYFYASQDADNFTTPEEVEPEEGAFYVWTWQELEEILSPGEFGELQAQFTVTKAGNFEEKNVLQRWNCNELSKQLESALAKLFAVRYGSKPEDLETFSPATNNQEAKSKNWPGRIPPVTDTKMIVAWNSLMISGLARAATVFQQSEYLKIATTAAQFILENQWVDERLHRVNYDGNPDVLAQSEDYALLIKALIDLHQASLLDASFKAPEYWFEKAVQVQQEFDQFLWSSELGGYYNIGTDAGNELLMRERSYIDNATPAANGVAMANLVRLFLLTEQLDYLDKAEQGLQAFSSIMEKSPQACPSLFVALDWYRNNTLVRSNVEHIKTLSSQYYPVTIFKVDTNLPEGVTGLVCQGLKCKKPANTFEEMQQQLQESQTRS
ncbi:thioredoxin domain-containing protein [Limnoraphis robusta Tam1]|uniref:thioredoxin domain-containing protein n=1 Tax=Limnoraphis robusta TaxID=1118279 RepID=UPI002B2182FE|nr:thioredoxin domain-containing protein [Limnoraphis robusta]MEA5543160.1 thioredoxin domain-containing protein [Limnoraphis robusta Tam1]